MHSISARGHPYGRVLTVLVLALAFLATLGSGAAPASAQTGCDCHAAVPPAGGAPAAHAPLVASVTECTVCHVSWMGPPHLRVERHLFLHLSGRSAEAGYQLVGQVWAHSVRYFPFLGHRGIVVYLQQRLWGATEWTDLTQVTTGRRGPARGAFTYTVPSPTPWAAYRAIARGHVASTSDGYGLCMPKTTTRPPKPTLTLSLSGLTNGSVAPGQGVTATGTATPKLLAGEEVVVTVYRAMHVALTPPWVVARAGTVPISATGTFAWEFSLTRRESYQVTAEIGSTDNHTAVRSSRYFTVK